LRYLHRRLRIAQTDFEQEINRHSKHIKQTPKGISTKDTNNQKVAFFTFCFTNNLLISEIIDNFAFVILTVTN
jgi:hypothetical protein